MPVIFEAENFTPCDDPRPTLTSENTTLSTVANPEMAATPVPTWLILMLVAVKVPAV